MAELERIKVDVYDLKVGLFISALDRPGRKLPCLFKAFKFAQAES